jgi:hypothetical protein
LSVEAVQVSMADPQVILVVGVPGMVGGWLSGGGHGGGTGMTGAVNGDVLPAVSRARTW